MAFDFPNSPTTGQIYSVSGGPTYVWNGTAWVVSTPGSQFNRTTFTATANQTTFTMAYTIGAIDIFRNGVKLNAADFTATNGTSFTLNNACTLGDTVEVITYGIVAYSDAVKKSGDTMAGALTTPMVVTDSPMMFRNKIINGAMEIDQRNGGASGTAVATYTVDRWAYNASQASKGTWQQNAGSVTPPPGFKNYLGFTSSSAYSLIAGDYFSFTQLIEGINVVDLAWGTANAKTITISFWVRSSLTGSFGGSVSNNNGTRTYPFLYTISSANTWEYKTVTIPGDTTGTWLTDNQAGVILGFGLGIGSTFSGTAGAWAGANYSSATGATSVVGTNGATFYLTGVQLEVGSVATPFERRNYQQELAMCQRYYEVDDIPASGAPKIATSGLAQGTTHYLCMFKVSKRTTPTVAITYISNIDNSTTAVGTTSISSGAFRGFNTIQNGSFFYADAWVRYAASAEL